MLRCDSLSSNEELALVELPNESIYAGKGFAAATILYFNGNGCFALVKDEIDFMVSHTPVGYCYRRAEARI